MFVAAPASIEAIAQAGLPSERITPFIIFIAIYTGKKPRIITKYSEARPMLFSDAPKSINTGILSG